jgi:hypothetical protein
VVEFPAKERIPDEPGEFETGQVTRDRLDDPAHPGPGAVEDELPTIDPVADQGGAAGPGPGPDVEVMPLDVTPWESIVEKPPTFLMDPFLPAGEVCVLGSHGGSGKSFVALSWAAHIAVGKPWGPLAVTQGRTCFLSFEDPARMVKFRLMNIIEEHGFDQAAVFSGIDLIDATDLDALVFEDSDKGIKRLEFTDIYRRLEKMIANYALVIVDNISECYDADESAKRQVKTFIKALKRLVIGHDGCVLLLGHIDKQAARNGSNGNSYAGSAAWHNSPRSRIALVDGELVHEKLTGARPRDEPLPIVWTNKGYKSVPVPDAFGTLRSKTMREQFDADDALILDALREATEAGEDVKASGRSTLETLSVRPGFPEVLVGEKRRVFTSLVRLEQGGKISKVEVKDKSTNYRAVKFWRVSRIE